jgi:hypothetical protein
MKLQNWKIMIFKIYAYEYKLYISRAIAYSLFAHIKDKEHLRMIL